MKLSFSGSELLYQVLAAVFVLCWLLSVFMQFRLRQSPVRAIPRGTGLSFLSLLFLLLAVNQPFIETRQQHSGLMALLDISDSMDPGSAAELLERLSTLASSGVEVIPFAGEAAPVTTSLSRGRDLNGLRSAWQGLNPSVSSLERAFLSLSRYEHAPLVLISDGRENSGSAEKAFARLQAQQLRIFPLLPLEDHGRKGAFEISNLHAPLVAPAQKSVDIRVTLRNTTSEKQRGRLSVKHGEKTVLDKQVEVPAGSSLLETAQSDAAAEGIRQVEAVLVPEGRPQQVNSRRVFVSAESREKVLLVSGSSEDERLLKRALQEQAYQLKAVSAEGGLVSLPDFGDFSTVLFNNLSYEQMPSGSDTKLLEYVKNGGGFLMLGGNRSFGLGGYKGTPVEDVLPVQILPPQSAKKRLNIAVELVLDKSRSMGENSKIDFAKEGAREVIRMVKDEDYVGVIGFDSVPFEVVKLDLAGRIREEALSRVGRLFATGKTMLLPAMEEARRRLNAALAGRKHMIILTDGQIEDAGTYYLEMVKQMRIMGITVSTVMVGGASDMGFLRSLAEAGGGAYYETSDPRSLPRIFISDVKVASGERTMKEQDEFVVRPGPDEILSTSIRQFPPLRGYVETARREKASLELVVQGAEKSDPLLASWSYGKGRSAAFTSDANGRWSSFWAGWSGYMRFWSEVIDSLRSDDRNAAEPVKFDLRHYFDKGRLTLDLSIFSEEAARNVNGSLIFPDGSQREVSFNRESPGHYQGSIEQLVSGKYEFRGSAAGRKLTPVAFELSSELFGEQRGLGFDAEILFRIAAATGGRVNPGAADLGAEYSLRSKKLDLTRLCLLLALLSFLGGIIRREVLRSNSRLKAKSEA